MSRVSPVAMKGSGMAKLRLRHLLPALAAAALLPILYAAAPAARDKAAAGGAIDYSRDIRPILAENCFACHGPDEAKRKAGLRLDVKEEALKALKGGGFAIVPHDLTKSSLIERITTADEEEIM